MTESTGMHGWQERVAAGSGPFWRLASSYGLQTLIGMAAEFWEGQEKLQDSVCLRPEVTNYPFTTVYGSHKPSLAPCEKGQHKRINIWTYIKGAAQPYEI